MFGRSYVMVGLSCFMFGPSCFMVDLLIHVGSQLLQGWTMQLLQGGLTYPCLVAASSWLVSVLHGWTQLLHGGSVLSRFVPATTMMVPTFLWPVSSASRLDPAAS